MFWLDGVLAVEQRVEEREPDGVCFGAGGELAEQPVCGLGELRVELPPQLAGGRGECDLPGGAGVREHAGEVAAQAGAFQRFGVAAFGQQPDPADGREDEAVQEPVSDLDDGGVAAQLGLGDVADDRDVRAGGARGRGAGQQRERPSVLRCV
jgi:hypothetical protein